MIARFLDQSLPGVRREQDKPVAYEEIILIPRLTLMIIILIIILILCTKHNIDHDDNKRVVVCYYV